MSAETRLVLDVSRLNDFIVPLRFRMTSVAQVRLTLRPGCWLASLDLRDAYWHVPIHPRYRPFLAFVARGQVFQFRVLPFGLNIAPRVFTKILQPVRSLLCDQGVQVLMYLDDWLIIAPSQVECASMLQTTLRLGAAMGLSFNLPKSHLHPSQRLQWLGLVWDTPSSTVSLSPTNRLRCWKKVFRALLSVTYTRRQWESLLGSLNHAAEVVPFGRIRVRRLVLEGRRPFSSPDRDLLVPFPQVLRSRLRWWVSRRRLFASSPWIPSPPVLTLTTDASDWGWGYQSSLGHQGSGAWSPFMARQHINVRELRAIYIALRLEPSLVSTSILVLSDNLVTVHCVNRMGSSRSSSLLSASEVLFTLARSRSVILSASHIAGEENLWADALSRRESSSVEWTLDRGVFSHLTGLFGRPQVDLFASEFNHRLDHFLTRASVTPDGGPDAFREDWNRWQYIYLFPPP